MSAADYTLRCPACNAVATVDCWAGNAHVYLRWLLDVPFGLMRHVLRYLGLFRSPAFDLPHLLAIDLLAELVPVMQSGTLQFESQTHVIPAACWQAGFDQMHKQRATIRNINNHVFLWRVVIALAQDFDAKAEAEREANRTAGKFRNDPPAKLLIDEVFELQQQRRAELDLAALWEGSDTDKAKSDADKETDKAMRDMHRQRAADIEARIAALKAAV